MGTPEANEEWWHYGLCSQTDPELFFPDKGGAAMSKVARELCRKCPVIVECLDDALIHPIHEGIRGGRTATELIQLRRLRRE